MLDRFYTPDSIADRVLEYAELDRPQLFVDTACGSGNLLRAASRLYPKASCAGADVDRTAIQQLRRSEPDWLLSVADILQARSRTQAVLFRKSLACDVLVLNPPFSMRNQKYVETEIAGSSVRSSIAMAHILRSVEAMRPTQGVLAIVPESMLHSDLDTLARAKLATEFNVDVLMELQSSTFSGARAHTAVIRLSRVKRTRRQTITISDSPNHGIEVVRGGLPLFEANNSRSGLSLVHTTDLRDVSAAGISALPTVKAIRRGRVSGSAILISRVGVPAASRAVHLRTEIQLSDCVIALCFPDLAKAKVFRDLLDHNWEGFSSLYRGTGARYLTVQRLSSFLGVLAARQSSRLPTSGFRNAKPTRT